MSSHKKTNKKKTSTTRQVVLIRDLCIYKGIVVSFLGQELAVGALLDHPSILDHHDDVGCLHGGQAMSNDDAGPTLPGVIQSFLDNLSTENTAILLAPEKASLVLGTTFDFSLSYHLNTRPTDIYMYSTGFLTEVSEPDQTSVRHGEVVSWAPSLGQNTNSAFTIKCI